MVYLNAPTIGRVFVYKFSGQEALSRRYEGEY
jgi:hypothetical protein